MIKIYLDACCLNRPFDDQSYPRIHLESEAIQLVLLYCETGYVKWYGSEILDYEINQTPDPLKMELLRIVAGQAQGHVALKETIRKRANVFRKWKITALDALHVACAENVKVDYFLTTDDKLLSKLRRHKRELKIITENPLKWVQEVSLP